MLNFLSSCPPVLSFNTQPRPWFADECLILVVHFTPCKREPSQTVASIVKPVGTFCGTFSRLLIDEAHCGGTIASQVGLDCVGKVCTPGSKDLGSVLQWFLLHAPALNSYLAFP